MPKCPGDKISRCPSTMKPCLPMPSTPLPKCVGAQMLVQISALKCDFWAPKAKRSTAQLTYSIYRTLYSSQPAYLHSALHVHQPPRSLRSSNTNLLSVPFVRTALGARSLQLLKFGTRYLYISFRTCTTPDRPTFRRHLKAHHFQLAFQSS